MKRPSRRGLLGPGRILAGFLLVGGSLSASPSILQLDLPGSLVSGAVARGASPALWLGTREGDQEGLSVHRFDTGASPRLSLRVARAPAGAEILATSDLDRDGSDELLLLAPGHWTLGTGSANGSGPQTVYAGNGYWVGSDAPGTIAAPTAPHPAAVAQVGGLSLLAAGDPAAPPFAIAALPIRAASRSSGLTLSSPRPVSVPGGGWVAWEEPEGREIPATWIPPTGGSVSLRLVLPEPERMQTARPLSLDGSPYLLVDSFVRIGPMANQRIRLFPLAKAEGRVAPVLARELEVHVWHAIEASVHDLDHDGHDDLVLAMPEGMGGGDLRLLAFRGTGAGRFDARPAETRLQLDGADWSFGSDVDGDRRPDLVLFRDGVLTVYPALVPGAALPESIGTDVGARLRRAAPARDEVAGSDATLSGQPGADVEADGANEVEVQLRGSSRARETERGDDDTVSDHQVIDVDGDGAAEILAWTIVENRTRLLLVRLASVAGLDPEGR